MPTRETAWTHGTPAWVDCTFEHMHAASKFYGRLFGWETHEGPAEAGGYTMCLKNGHPAAALAPVMSDPIVPNVWSVFFASDDVDATAQRVVDAGGKVLIEPMDILDAGRMAFFEDAEGATFGVWQAQGHIGFEVYNEPGSVGWTDLMSRDLGKAQDFYASVFGFMFEPMGEDYLTFKLADGGPVVGGLHQAAHLPADAPANWLVHFVVASRDATVAIVEELDGEVLGEFDTPAGPEATVRGPEGEIFNVIEMKDVPAQALLEQLCRDNSASSQVGSIVLVSPSAQEDS